MKIIKNLLPVLFLLLQLGYLNAQVPGYAGKKFSIGYEASLFPYFDNNYSYRHYSSTFSEPSSFMGVNFRNNIRAEYVLSRNISAGASYQYLKTGATISNLNIETKIYSVSMKFFSFNSKGSIAPLGFYNKIELGLGVSEWQMIMNAGYGNAYLYTSKDVGNSNVKSLFFTYSFGEQQLLFDRLLINVGAEMGSSLSYPIRAIIYTHQGGSKINRLKEVDGRLFRHLLMNVDVGIALLIF